MGKVIPAVMFKEAERKFDVYLARRRKPRTGGKREKLGEAAGIDFRPLLDDAGPCWIYVGRPIPPLIPQAPSRAAISGWDSKARTPIIALVENLEQRGVCVRFCAEPLDVRRQAQE